MRTSEEGRRDDTCWSWLLEVFSAACFWRWLCSLLFSTSTSTHPDTSYYSPIHQTSDHGNQVIPSRADTNAPPRLWFKIAPSDVLRYIVFEYLLPKDRYSFMKIQHHGIFRERGNDPIIMALPHNELCRLVAIEGEENQKKAESLLNGLTPEQAFYLISTKIPSTKDAAGRVFETPMSAYGYAFWAGDTDMCVMLQEHMDDATKAAVHAECQRIKTEGVTFTLNGVRVEHSHHWDWQPLIDAYQRYLAEAERLRTANLWSWEDWANARALYLKIGEEQAKVPTHVAQQYCSNEPFAPLEHYLKTLYTSLAFLKLTLKEFKKLSAVLTDKTLLLSATKENYQSIRFNKEQVKSLQDALKDYPNLTKKLVKKPELKRTTQFESRISSKIESWFPPEEAPSSELGISSSVGKAERRVAAAVRPRRWSVSEDLAAITAQCEMRTISDLEQTLDALIKPAGSDHKLGC